MKKLLKVIVLVMLSWATVWCYLYALACTFMVLAGPDGKSLTDYTLWRLCALWLLLTIIHLHFLYKIWSVCPKTRWCEEEMNKTITTSSSSTVEPID